jgi:hypothetical protein
LCKDSWDGRRSVHLLRTRHLVPFVSAPLHHLFTHTKGFKLKSHQTLKRSLLKDKHSIGTLTFPFHRSQKSGIGRVDGFPFGEDGGVDGGYGDPELREIFVFPDMFGGYGVEDIDTIEDSADSTGCRFHLVRSARDEIRCEGFEAEGYQATFNVK